jgi:transcriptional regulator with XRE-family HTH domain
MDITRPPTREELGQALRAARHELGWTQERVAQVAKVSPITVVRVETGYMNPSARVLFAIVVALGAARWWRHLGHAVGGDARVVAGDAMA